ncbi:DL-endopeptidase inhibitor IseA family protein [Clostridium oryzae]|uniref:Uncharacterized protein n=1 Tax=Clostridium oryzae TaxID=1450648 RepID=A0A1V4IR13_9CLOT|nr:DL-endopeptidase inhibitor IseA family protein [Clostridium oryzae]OPJ62225.1 hypothetical protein CLORY_18330 [Clostridium oryzae]
MKLLKSKKNLISIITVLAILISTLGCNVFAKSSKKITDKQAVEISFKAFYAFDKLFGLGVNGKSIDVEGREYGKISSKIKSDKAFFAYIEKKTSMGKYYSKKYENKIVKFLTVIYESNYYMVVGDPEIGVYDLASAKVKSKKYNGKNVTVTLEGKGDEGKEATTTVVLTYEKNKWVVSNWSELNEGLQMK